MGLFKKDKFVAMKTYVCVPRSESESKVLALLDEGEFRWSMKHSRWESRNLNSHSIAAKIRKLRKGVKSWYKGTK